MGILKTSTETMTNFNIPAEDSLSNIFKGVKCYKLAVKRSIQLFHEQ